MKAPNSRRRIGNLLTTIPTQVILIFFSILAIFPVYYMAVTAFKTRPDWLRDQFGLPNPFTLQNITDAFKEGEIPIWFGNSLIVTVASVIVSTAVSALAAYAIARFHFRGRAFYFNMMIALMVIPPAVLILPLFVLMVNIGLINTLPSVIIIYCGLLIPFSVYLLVSFFSSLPPELFDAASIDGCNNLDTFWRITLPLSIPALVTLIVVNALFVWNELLIALVFLQEESHMTLMPGLTLFKGHFTVNEPLIMAGTLIATIPMVLLYLFGQRLFVEGLTAGAIK
ncbi:MAG: carbohydrate ABC transporter permease [Anaerolineales bacterium]|jgi:ABC-type glycerol-3-phosphate transport system permease component